MPMATKEEQREYQRQWMAKRRQNWIDENGPCVECNSTDQLEVDHINPEDKELQPRDLWSRRKEVRETELAKCQVLCYDCHLKKTQKWYEDKREHGTITMYKHGCRCSFCRQASTEDRRKYPR